MPARTYKIQKQALIYALTGYLVLKLITAALIFVAQPFEKPYPVPPVHFSAATIEMLDQGGKFSQLFLAPWYRWDTTHYLEIAEEGYAANLVNTVWPPFFPALIRLVGFIFTPSILAGIIVSNLSAILAFYFLFVLVKEHWGETTASTTLLLLFTFPTAFYLIAVYTESLFLLLTAGCFLALHKKQWIWAGIFAAVASLTRLQGAILVLPVMAEGLIQLKAAVEGRRVLLLKLCAAIFMTPLALAIFTAYVHFGLGAGWPWNTLNQTWELHFAWPWEGLWGSLTALLGRPVIHSTGGLILFYDLFLTCISMIAMISVGRKLPVTYQVYAWSMLLFAVTKINSDNLLVSMDRYLLTIFPLFIALAIWLQKRKRVAPVWYSLSFLSQLLLFFVFYSWKWAG